MNKIIFLILLFTVACSNKNASKVNKTEAVKIDVSNDIVFPKHYIIPKTAGELTIDGKADESQWKNAPFSTPFIDIEGVKKPKFDTKVKMLWDDKYLYVYALMEEPHVWGNLRQRDTIIFYNNDFEIFLSPSGTTKNYGEIEINALGTVWDLILDVTYRVGGKPNYQWNLDSLKSAVHINGSLNDFSDIDSSWSVELAIPLSGLIPLKSWPLAAPIDGEQWRLNFSRVQWDFDTIGGRYARKKDEKGEFQREYNWVWSSQGVIAMHEPEKWGIIQFSDSTSIQKVVFKKDTTLPIQQGIYALFRKTAFGDMQYLLDEKIGYHQTFEVTYHQGKTFKADFYRTNFGFEYVVDLEELGIKYVINEISELRKIEV